MKRKLLWFLVLTLFATVSTIIIPLVFTQRPAVDSKILALRVLLCVISVVAMANFSELKRKAWNLTDTVFSLLLLTFTASLLLSGRIAYSFQFSWQHAGLIVLSWMVYRLQPDIRETRTFLWLAAALAFLAALYGFSTYTGYDILRPLYPFNFEENQGGRNFIHSFFGNPEYFAGYVAPGALLLLGFTLLSSARTHMRVTCFGLMIFILGVMALSGSRGAFAGFLAGSIVLSAGQIVTLPAGNRKIIIRSVLGLLALGILGITILSTPNPLNPKDMRLAKRFSESFNTQSASFRERLLFYTSTSRALTVNPVWGSGPGTFRLDYINNVKLTLDEQNPGIKAAVLKEMNNRLAEHAHNDYLEFWFDYGFAGFAAFILLIAHMSVRFFITRISLLRSRLQSGLLFADFHLILFCAIVAILLNALSSFPFQMSARSTLVWILIGVFFAVDSQLTRAQLRSPNHDADTA